MKSSGGWLTPFVRSDAVGALLAETLGRPEEETSLSELSRRTGVSLPVVHREVSRLVEAGVLTDRTEGRNRLVRADRDHPLYAPMREIVELTYGPIPVLRDELAEIEGADEILIYGSWAARRAGEPGAFPNDLDVLVVGDAPRRVLIAAAARAGECLRIPVNVTRLSRDDWEATDPTPFVRTVRSRPRVDVATGLIDE